ncbi:MAG TPA: hypothetical protein VJA25_11725 [Dehalococcoidia bacterium]|nr:hypothetical protein [Dehalococcoidia bacterium]
MKPCRYLEQVDGGAYCVYWDMALRGDEDLWCHPGGCEYYEEPSGCIFEGRWMTLTEYADHMQRKSEREIPEGLELQDFRLDSKGLAELSGRERRYPLESLAGEFHYLKMRPEYPHHVKMVAIAYFHCGGAIKPPSFDHPEGSQWVASVWIADGSCEVDLTAVLKGESLEFIQGSCLHGYFCPGVEKLKRAVLESQAFAQLRGDLIHELCQAAVGHPHSADRLPSPQMVPPWEEDGDLWP